MVRAHDGLHRTIGLLHDTQRPAVTDWLVRWVFLRTLGLIYLIAFVSFGSQILGLIGSNGILPAQEYLQWVGAHTGPEKYWLVPTVFWLNSSDAFLQLVSLAGVILSLLLLLGFGRPPILLLLFLLYVSLVSAGQDWMAYQWDSLLLETGFLAIFISSSSSVVTWLFRWLLFRLMFLSGTAKLLSGDPTWRNLTALDFHFETQPLPTVLGWYMYQLPEWFHRFSVIVMFSIELVVPFLIFAPRRLRFFAAAAIVFFQALILLTGNYGFFNLLTIALCVLLLDDALLQRFLPQRLVARIRMNWTHRKERRLERWVMHVVVGAIVLVSALQLLQVFGSQLPAPGDMILEWAAPLRVVNTYGLFAVMTTSRPEIIIEGSNDGSTWLEYEFKYKPGDLDRAPVWAEPLQPRLDWQMWFAALGYSSDKPWTTQRLFASDPSAAFGFSNLGVDAWVLSFMQRLQQGSPQVLALMGHNPFSRSPPRYVRAVLYDYGFTDLATLNAKGEWWQRGRRRIYLSPGGF